MAQNNSSEQRYLADQAADARTAIMQIVQEMKATLIRAADVRTCARQHPWIATGSAVAAGFVAGVVLPTRRTKAREGSPSTTDAGAPLDHPGPQPAHAKTGFLMNTLGTALTGIVQTLLQGFLTAAVVATEVDQVKEEPQPPYGATPFDSNRGGRPEDVTL